MEAGTHTRTYLQESLTKAWPLRSLIIWEWRDHCSETSTPTAGGWSSASSADAIMDASIERKDELHFFELSLLAVNAFNKFPRSVAIAAKALPLCSSTSRFPTAIQVCAPSSKISSGCGKDVSTSTQDTMWRKTTSQRCFSMHW